jgi:hypothetical protein
MFINKGLMSSNSFICDSTFGFSTFYRTALLSRKSYSWARIHVAKTGPNGAGHLFARRAKSFWR